MIMSFWEYIWEAYGIHRIPPVSKVASGNPFFLAGDSPMDKAESEKAGAVSWGPS